MNQANLSRWLKFITIAVGLMGLVVFLLILPQVGKDIVNANMEYENAYWPWLIFIWIMAVPCYIALFIFWGICNRIEQNHSFSIENTSALVKISKLAILDSIICFVGNIIFYILDLNHPGIFIGFLFVVFAGIAIAIVSAALAHLVEKASSIQDENDLTI